MLLLFLSILALIVIPFVPVVALAAWTPLITSADFDGIKSDVMTTGGSILLILLIILGIGFIVRAFR